MADLPNRLNNLWQENLQKFARSCAEKQQTNPLSDADADFVSSIKQVWTGSDFAADQCLLYPERVGELKKISQQYKSVESVVGRISARCAFNHKDTLSRLCDSVDTEPQLMAVLRRYRNREMVRIIWQDLNRLESTESIMADLSALADSSVNCSLEWLYRQQILSMGKPADARDNTMTVKNDKEFQKQSLVVLALGKLGACELNLSSDIDLMFAYPAQGETSGTQRSWTNQEFFIRLGQSLIRVLDSQTSDGFVFRVDMRLRPYGESGPLAMSFSAMEQYYQDQGRDWERYAMIKARAVAGDRSQGVSLLRLIRPFVYRRYLDFSAITALRDMKQRVIREVKRKGMENNIKLGHGGIREIEFIAQVFQLIHGGRYPLLQTRSLLKALEILGQLEYLPASTVDELRDAYLFLRNLEHALQSVADQQTQTLPSDEITCLRVANSMHYSDWFSLCDMIEHHRHKVDSHFRQIISDESGESESVADQWRQWWQGDLTEGDEEALMKQEGFHDPDNCTQYLRSTRNGMSARRASRQGRERLERFIPGLLKAVTQTSDPDICLKRVLPVVEAIIRRSAYLVLLTENPQALDHLCKLCGMSPWIAGQIVRYPVLLDEFLHLGKLYTPPDKSVLRQELKQQLSSVGSNDLEGQMEILRYFKMAHVLRVGAAHAVNTLPLMKESDYLTWIAEVILEQVLFLAWQQMIQRYGSPDLSALSSCDEGERNRMGFIIVGYGKLGGIEMGPGSDLDLVFVYDENAGKTLSDHHSIDAASFYMRLGQRIIHILTTRTLSGILYETDMRLRPSGASGLLVTSLSAFEKYQDQNAWTWEHQSLVRARAITGDLALIKRFIDVRIRILKKQRDLLRLRSDVIEMREKMRQHLLNNTNERKVFHLKQGVGGIVDIEFMMQFAVLAHCHTMPDIGFYSDNIRISESLERAGVMTEKQSHLVRTAYQILRKMIHQRAFQHQDEWIPVDDVEPYVTAIEQLWQQWLLVDNKTS
ncbi:Bifunctional glutamine synthetase adenylyltransferase/adenylyl-removing enzyme [invertebrate metagenome]|uniref:Bifunctional glutamine synthetase adenylyltransferase/adenylyl-removing enzyme n=1 Tax=invertebrate metagenome TaxID=1711999 RepID=A0A2H9T8P9_9ZZZZ